MEHIKSFTKNGAYKLRADGQIRTGGAREHLDYKSSGVDHCPTSANIIINLLGWWDLNPREPANLSTPYQGEGIHPNNLVGAMGLEPTCNHYSFYKV